jgi:STE24 endopeptidase
MAQNSEILWLFIAFRFGQHLLERVLSSLNRKYYENEANQKEAIKLLKISDEDMQKALVYSRDRFKFSSVSSWVDIVLLLGFIGLSGLGYTEQLANSLTAAWGGGPIITGLIFFALLALLGAMVELPFELYHTFVLEERHGFNRQTVKGFWTDKLKGLILSAVLLGILLSLVLWIMQTLGKNWWIVAWLAVFGFSLFTAWLYPTVLAPIFNKFSPLEEGELKEGIMALARKVGFKASGISIMDASKRSTHGNAYFSGVFGKKKIVLFDNLLKSMNTEEIIAVLAHELGHFKLNHIRWRLVFSFFMMGGMFYLLSLVMDLDPFYAAFDLAPRTSHGALMVFSLWFGLISFLLQPISSYFSRKHEFAADQFALRHLEGHNYLADALLKLRETSHLMPINHPLFSAVYLSHPPLVERLKTMGYGG